MMGVVDVIRERFSKRPAFSIQEVKKHTKHVHQVLHYLLKRGEVVRIAKGYYTFHRDVMVVGFAYFPYYYGLHEALSLYNLTEQETNPVVITPRKVRPGMRQFLGRNYVVRRISRPMFFGYTTMKYYDFHIYISDYEKTLIDFLYFKEPLRQDELEALLEKIEREKLKAYLRHCPRWLARRVEGVVGR